MIDTGIFPGFKEAEYFALNDGVKRGDPEWVVSRSDLAQILRCPAEWRAGAEEKDSESLTIGSLVDCLLLTPDEFAERFALRPPTYKGPKTTKKDAPIVDKKWNANATVCKEWEAKQEELGLQVISQTQMSKASKMAHNLKDRWFKDAGMRLSQMIEEADTQTLAIAEIEEPHTGIKVMCRCLIDLLHPGFDNFLWDLKTGRELQPKRWSAAVAEHGYDIQCAMYPIVYEAAGGESKEAFGHLIVGNQYPYLTAIRYLSDHYLSIGRQKFWRALRTYCECLQSGKFPGWSPEGMEKVGPPAWEAKEWEAVA